MTTQMAHTANLESGDTINITVLRNGKTDTLTLEVRHTKRDNAIVHLPGNDNKLGDLSAIPPTGCDDDQVVSYIKTKPRDMVDTINVIGVEVEDR